jgi:hypothetical protein
MLARFQMILRRGAPKRDLLMLRLDYHFNGKLHRGNGIRDDVIYETMHLRAHRGIYWRDMSLQDAGFTWDYIAPQLLEEPEVTFQEGLISPEGPAYRALIIFQDVLPLSSAKRILQWAREGLRIFLVNGVTEEIRNEIYATYPKAAAKTPYYDRLDGGLEETIEELKRQPNVRVVEKQEDVYKTLLELGVKPRSPFAEPNREILTLSREDGNVRYLYVYHYMYTEKESFCFTVGIEGEGKPYFVDCWKNVIEEIGLYTFKDGYTWVSLNLAPGEAAIIALEPGGDVLHAVSASGGEVLRKDGRLVLRAFRSGGYTVKLSNGTEASGEVSVPVGIDLPEWELEVESWDEGEKRVLEEDRGLGYITREVYYETKKTPIRVGKTRLIPWKDIAQVGPEVSGLGVYTARFKLPESWNRESGAILRIGSVNGNSLAVFVNGEKTPVVDYSRLEANITGFLVPGENTVKVEVSSTLNNRLIARRYFDNIHDTSGIMIEGKPRIVEFGVQDYGMTGKAEIMFYTDAGL